MGRIWVLLNAAIYSYIVRKISKSSRDNEISTMDWICREVAQCGPDTRPNCHGEKKKTALGSRCGCVVRVYLSREHVRSGILTSEEDSQVAGKTAEVLAVLLKKISSSRKKDRIIKAGTLQNILVKNSPEHRKGRISGHEFQCALEYSDEG
jgi:hypothetical protein